MKDYRIYWIWLAERAGHGSPLAVKLINIFGNAYSVYSADADRIDSLTHGELTDREAARAKRIISDKSTEEAERILADAESLGQRVIVPTDKDYPVGLTSLRNAPMALYMYGSMPKLEDRLAISVVGTRTMSDSGRRSSYAMGYGLAGAGAVVVSGMALGCDGMALCGALDAGGKTVAVLGGGVDVVYPRDHEMLYTSILKKGAVISEYPPRTRPKGSHFPVRNRIISGISSGSVIIEAQEGSGALITARHALNQGRNVFAVPGDVGDSRSFGTNELIKNGVYVATSACDVIAEYEFIYPHCASMTACKRALRRLDAEVDSEEAMERLRISKRGGEAYHGGASYGGKSDRLAASKTKTRVARGDIKNSERTVPMGDAVEESVLVVQSAESDLKVKSGNGAKAKGTDSAPDAAAGKARDSRIEVDLLDELNIKVYNMMTPDVPTNPDELASRGIRIGDVLSSLSLLEIAGAVEASPGGYFTRISDEEISFDPEAAL